ncbi:cation diffusion facilitator transporter [Kitasatospora herbaricolor]|uniref:cation diffusion facilitator family transporter n=1 Tax=Kitasatospora herbaricolor TaxID=68217 RepID=UPI00174810E1|nr:cation diffusion facilitator family transporter [Kitasatospora herbaricolor]MDQ0312757.1 cation diffusion facilitator family transporter [Kitasatospora herbaricolor]GGV35581.1 cation diffusion facilitator transporter [Kitasatospora herbaricolor]
MPNTSPATGRAEHPVEAGPPGAGESSESTVTVIVAGLCNLGISIAKAAAGVIGGSGAMLSEAAHSLADTVTEVLLYFSLKRSTRPADDTHPFGYSRERYVWALLASFATFVGGAVFSVNDGVHTLTGGAKEPGSPVLSYVVLGIAFALESVSLARTVRQVRGDAGRLGVSQRRYLRLTPDTAVKAVYLEDVAALIGLLLAFGGLLGSTVTGSEVWDGCASLLIGALLAWVAVVLARANGSLLIGRALPGSVEERIAGALRDLPQVRQVVDLVTLVHGPQDILVAAKVAFESPATAHDVELACEHAEQVIRSAFPAVSRVYLDPTPGRRGPAGRADRPGGSGKGDGD